jgi:leader peptidase (prepilin peptidase) / N-methyltransferase
MMAYLIVALFGLAFGSFLNVCIYRLPRGESVVSPGSHCPACERAIRWHDNLPLVSYLLLRGRCRDCQTAISPRYPVVEALAAAVVLADFRLFGLTPEFFRNAVFCLLIIVVIFTDLYERRIPHSLTLFGIAVGVILSAIIPVDSRPIGWLARLWNYHPQGTLLSILGALAGGLIGGGLFYVVGEAFYHLRHKEGLGFGDVMLMLMTGTFLGPAGTLLTILLGSLLGTVVAIPLSLVKAKFRNYQWPYGTFLGVAAIYTCLRGEALLRAYLHWAGFR